MFQTKEHIFPILLFKISVYLIDWLHFPTLAKWSRIDVLCIPAARSPLLTRAVYSRGASCLNCMSLSVVVTRLPW